MGCARIVDGGAIVAFQVVSGTRTDLRHVVNGKDVKACENVLTTFREALSGKLTDFPSGKCGSGGGPLPKILKLVDVARHLGIPKRTLYDMINTGRFIDPIPGTNPRRWNFDDVERWRSPATAADTAQGG